jgi:uncharacterized repeat protein (TIGR03943 family)
MSPRLQRSLQSLVLAALGLFLLQKLWSGTLFWYINQRFALLVLLAAMAFLALARVVLPAPRAPAAATGKAGAPGPAHDHTPHPADDDAHGGAARVWGLLLVALPVIVGVLVPARPLGSRAVANKGINITAPLTAGATAPVQRALAPTDRTVLDWVRAFNAAGDPQTFAGEPADVVGWVYHDARLPADQFLVSRFAVTCCAADAVAVGVLVRWPGAARLDNDAWVRVTGPVEVDLFAGRATPLVTAAGVEGVAAPAQPYLYP